MRSWPERGQSDGTEAECKYVVRSRYIGAFVHSIAWVQHERGTTVGRSRRSRLSMPRRLLPSLIVSNAVVPIVKERSRTLGRFPRYPIV